MLILKIGGVVTLLIFIFILTLIALFSIEIYIKEYQSSDPKEIIIDEFIGQLIVLIFASFSSLAIFIGFLLFRFFDISKLYPVNKVEKKYLKILGSINKKTWFKAFAIEEASKLLKQSIKNGEITQSEYNEWKKAQRVVQ